MNTEQKMELLRQKCANCKWFKDGWCLDMNIHVNPNSLCVSWEKKEKDDAAK